MKPNRRPIAILICAVLILTTPACGTNNDAQSDTTEILATEQSTADGSLTADVQIEEMSSAEETESTEAEDNSALLALAAESIYMEDENEYGNSIGNIYHDGVVTSGVSGSVYYYNMYDGNIYLFLESVDIGILLAEEDILYLNYMDGVLYGVKGDGAIAAYDISGQTEKVLREGGSYVEYLQLVNDRLYFIDQEDNTLRSISINGGDEQILVDEAVSSAVVYKDIIIFVMTDDNESLYSISIDGGEATKLNSQASQFPIVYQDKIYYATCNWQYEDHADSQEDSGSQSGSDSQEGTDAAQADGIRVMNMDGTEDRLIYEDNATQLNLYDGVLYYVNYIDQTKICCINLETEEVSTLDMNEKVISLINKTYEEYGMGTCESCGVTGYGSLGFQGNYMIFLCGEEIDGVSYTDELVYNMETEALYSTAQISKDGSELDALWDLIQEEYTSGTAEDTDTASTDRDYPNGDYTVGSVYGPKLTQSQLNEVADAVQEFLDLYDTDSMDDYTKILTAHDYLCETCSYAADWSVNGANTAWGALIYHEAQCSGYARAMKALCDGMGVGCYYVHASDAASNPSHQWNVCCVDGSWYIVDVQCNDSSGYKAFFLVSDATYKTTGMRWDTSSVPECPEDYEG